MTCYHPNTAYVSGQRETGTNIISFGLPEKPDQETFLLPCGQCIGCRLDRSIQWAARCMHEAQMHDSNQFITLTYNDENLPHDGSLTPPHFTNFMKRYRKALGDTKIRFYHGAEYGDELNRPHHHAIIFGHEFSDKEAYHECEGLITYYSPALERLWGKGFCTTAEVTLESAAYVARYCTKKITGDKADEHYTKTCETTGEVQTVIPEYSTMSRKPGIGRDWYQKYSADIFPHDTCVIRGKTVRTPRYYENLLRSTDELAYDDVKSIRKARALLHSADQTPDRLRAREKVKLASMHSINRKLHHES